MLAAAVCSSAEPPYRRKPADAGSLLCAGWTCRLEAALQCCLDAFCTPTLAHASSLCTSNPAFVSGHVSSYSSFNQCLSSADLQGFPQGAYTDKGYVGKSSAFEGGVPGKVLPTS